MTSSVLTRMLTEADAAAFRQIQRRSLDEAGKTHEWIPTEDRYAARFNTDWNGQAGFVIGAFDSELVGSICCRRDVAFAPMFWDLYVMPSRRGCGFGERLVRAAVARATEWPVSKKTGSTSRPPTYLLARCTRSAASAPTRRRRR